MSPEATTIIKTFAAIGKDQSNGVDREYISDGSNHPSKRCRGKLFKLGRTDRGLRLYIRCGNTVRRMSWRMGDCVVDEILSYVYRCNYANHQV